MCAAEMPTLLKDGPAPAMCTSQGGPSTCLPAPLTTPPGIPKPPRPRLDQPSASLVYEPRSTRTTDAGTSGYAPALPQCFRQPVGQETQKVKQNSKESKLQVVFSECLLFPYSSACYYSNIVRPTCLGPTWGEYDPVYFTSLPVYQLVQCT